jgi:signal transduction histidine kinase
MVGSLFMIMGGFITTLHDLFFLPSNILFYETGLLLELIIFSYALSMQHIKIEREKNKAELLNRKLEYEAVKRENLAREQFAMKLLEYQENERNRIALELHDSIGQKLLLIKNQLLSNIRIATDETTAKSLKGISDITGDTIQEIRTISRNLRPQHLDQLGLKTAIETLVESIENSCDIKYNLCIDEIDGLIRHEHEINFYRIVQECLNNIVKHSKATEASVQIKKTGNYINLKIEDNGVRIPSFDNKSYNGLGIAGIQQRTKMMGGVLSVSALENGGTLIEMNYPLKPEF